MITETCNLQDAKIHLSRLIQAVSEGADVIISEGGKPVACLSSLNKTVPRIRFGVLKGKAKVSDDFDAPLPESMISEFEGNT